MNVINIKTLKSNNKEKDIESRDKLKLNEVEAVKQSLKLMVSNPRSLQKSPW